VTATLNDKDIASEYEKNTGHVIVRAFEKSDYAAVPAVLVANHGPFAWGPDPAAAAHNAVILEAIARMAYFTLTINHESESMSGSLRDKHYSRKHGSGAYYGQPKEKG
jgi:L-ribulose-5-phosphate 4-epimerase